MQYATIVTLRIETLRPLDTEKVKAIADVSNVLD